VVVVVVVILVVMKLRSFICLTSLMTRTLYVKGVSRFGGGASIRLNAQVIGLGPHFKVSTIAKYHYYYYDDDDDYHYYYYYYDDYWYH